MISSKLINLSKLGDLIGLIGLSGSSGLGWVELDGMLKMIDC